MSMAGLHKYFKPALPIIHGHQWSGHREANAGIEKALEEGRLPRKRKYQHFTPEQHGETCRYAAENTNAAAVRKFSDEFKSLGESTVRLFKKAYLSKLSKGGGTKVKLLPKNKRGRSLTLGELDGDVQKYLNALRKVGTLVNPKITIAMKYFLLTAKVILRTLFRIWTELKTH